MTISVKYKGDARLLILAFVYLTHRAVVALKGM